MALLELRDASLQFSVRQRPRMTLKEYLLRAMFRPSYNPFKTVHALEHVTLRLTDGDRLGIVGHNGAGKSTLLKVLAGVYPPTGGERRCVGKVSSLFDLTLGFEPDASGWENVMYRGYLQGETPKSIRGKMAAIAEFSELGEFLNTPVRFYSSGMIVRLAFSVATAITPEILIIDEVMAAGDLDFQRKSRQRMLDMISQARVMIMVSHDLTALTKTCNRGIWLDHGTIRMDGTIHDVIRAYRKSVGISDTEPLPGAENWRDTEPRELYLKAS